MLALWFLGRFGRGLRGRFRDGVLLGSTVATGRARRLTGADPVPAARNLGRGRRLGTLRLPDGIAG